MKREQDHLLCVCGVGGMFYKGCGVGKTEACGSALESKVAPKHPTQAEKMDS